VNNEVITQIGRSFQAKSPMEARFPPTNADHGRQCPAKSLLRKRPASGCFPAFLSLGFGSAASGDSVLRFVCQSLEFRMSRPAQDCSDSSIHRNVNAPIFSQNPILDSARRVPANDHAAESGFGQPFYSYGTAIRDISTPSSDDQNCE
jgi:hypothetical protein